MTAEIYLGVLLGALSSTIIVSVFVAVIWRPLQNYLVRRSFGKGVNLTDYASAGYAPAGSCVASAPEGLADHFKHFDAQQDLMRVALDVRENGHGVDPLVAAALAFRETTTPQQRKHIRAMAAFRKAEREDETGDRR